MSEASHLRNPSQTQQHTSQLRIKTTHRPEIFRLSMLTVTAVITV